MRYLHDFNDFRLWMIEVAFMTSEAELEKGTSLVSYQDDILPELNRLTPLSYPCIVYLEGGSQQFSSNKIKFIKQDQVEQWAMKMNDCR